MSTLTQIATDMRTLLNPVQTGYVEKALFGGLHIVMERRGTTWRLAIAREKGWPSEQEIATVTKHFGLAEDVTWERMQKEQKKTDIHTGGRGRGRGGVHIWTITWNVAECTWKEKES